MSNGNRIDPASHEPGRMTNRIVGYDVARAIAIFGMVVHHFTVVMAADTEHPRWLARLLEFFDGRPAALFVILAGIGVTLKSRRAIESCDPTLIARDRTALAKRGVALLLLGFLNLVIWPGDILRVYGVSLLLAAPLIDASNGRLIAVAASFLVGFVAMFLTLDYGQNWDWDTMTYHGLWTPAGVVRNLFYDGFRSVFPWSGYLFFGMWLGRKKLDDRQTNLRWLMIGVSMMLISEVVSAVALSRWLSGPVTENQRDEIVAVWGTISMPPLPLFLVAASGTAIAIIAACIRIAQAWPNSLIVKSLAPTGQMALTWYFTHIVIGLGTVLMLDAVGNQTLIVATLTGSLFFALAVCLSCFWMQRFQFGPLEWAFRKLTG